MTSATHRLHMQFDAKQRTQALQYNFMLADEPIEGHPLVGKPAKTYLGEFAGCFQFQKSNSIQMGVTMTNFEKDQEEIEIEGFEIVSLDLISLPDTTWRQNFLSPFSEDYACLHFVEWQDAVKRTNKDHENDIISRTCEHKDGNLKIKATTGCWKLSGFLSVKITAKYKGTKYKVPRVYSFDPEVIVGDGRDPGN